MEISIFKDYSIFDAGKQRNIEEVIKKLPAFTDELITLDFTNCLIDYPATSKLIDKILSELSNMKGSKVLTIQSDLTVNNENLILSLLVWGSSFFDFSSLSRVSTAEDYRKVIIPKLKEYQMKIEIQLLKDDRSIFKSLNYE